MFGKLFKKAASSAKNVELGVETEVPVEGEGLDDVEGGVSVSVSSKDAAKAARGLGKIAKNLEDKKGGNAAGGAAPTA